MPGKPLLEVNGLPIICHVVKKAQETQIGEVIVATEDEEILSQVKKHNGEAVLTSKKPQTGTDRIWEAFQKLKLKNIDFIINLQGDEPLINVDDIKNLDHLSKKNNCLVNTLASKIDKKSLKNRNVVKVFTENNLEKKNFQQLNPFQDPLII